MSAAAVPFNAQRPSAVLERALLVALTLSLSLGVLALAAPSVAARLETAKASATITLKSDNARHPPSETGSAQWLPEDASF